MEDENKDYWSLSERLCRYISENPKLLVDVNHRLMKFPIARKYFMEHHPMRDLACTIYSQYFLTYLKYNSGMEARLFAYGFLFMGAFLSDNMELQKLYFKEVNIEFNYRVMLIF